MDSSAFRTLADLSPYIYGTTRLGDDSLPMGERVQMASTAMRANVWFHASHQYGNALDVLRLAFDLDRSRVPKMIFKIGWENVDEVRSTIEQLKAKLAIPHMDRGQLCLNGELADEFQRGGECCEQLLKLRHEGLVSGYVLQVFPWTSQNALNALRAGHADALVDGFIFYLNPLQRFASNELWDEMLARKSRIVAMRTVAGGHVRDLRDVPGAAWQPYLQKRATEVCPIFENSGVRSWPEFCVRFAHSHPGVVATVGSTCRAERLDELVAAAKTPIEPLPAETMSELHRLQRTWAVEVDAHGKPGSM